MYKSSQLLLPMNKMGAVLPVTGTNEQGGHGGVTDNVSPITDNVSPTGNNDAPMY